MTIRYTCAECASVLKIKDELSGTNGRCPKCKTKFIVPKAGSNPLTPVLDVIPASAVKSKGDAASDPLFPLSESSAPSGVSSRQPKPTHRYVDEGESESQSEAGQGEEIAKNLTDELSVSPTVVDPEIEGDRPSMSRRNESRRSSNKQSSQMGNVDSMADDSDDDLDSPPLFIGSSPSEETPDTKSRSKRKTSSVDIPPLADEFDERPEKNEKNRKQSSGKTRKSSFDPVKFLADDVPSRNEPASSRGMFEDSDLSLDDDSDDNILNRPTPQPEPKRKVAPSASRPTPEKVDLVAASKMMKKAIKTAQSDANRQRKLNEKPGYDYFLVFREFGMQGLATLVVCGLLIVASMKAGQYFLGPDPLKTPELCRVRGIITLDGRPVHNATITFQPRKTPDQLVLKGQKRERERASIGISDVKGQFKMMYSKDDNIEGVAVGKCRVWVEHFGPQGSDVPFKWSEGVVNELEVPKSNQPLIFPIDMVTEVPR